MDGGTWKGETDGFSHELLDVIPLKGVCHVGYQDERMNGVICMQEWAVGRSISSCIRFTAKLL